MFSPNAKCLLTNSGTYVSVSSPSPNILLYSSTLRINVGTNAGPFNVGPITAGPGSAGILFKFRVLSISLVNTPGEFNCIAIKVLL